MEIGSFITEDDVRLYFAFAPPASSRHFTLLCTHGVNSNFYSTPLLGISELLAKDGHGYLVLNNRGHDWMSLTERRRWLGSAYERFEDCAIDLGAATRWLVERGHDRIALVGHSLGALKAGYTQAHAPHPAVVALAMCSGPSLRAEYGADPFEQNVARAKQLVDSGKGEELMFAEPPADRPGLRGPFSAGTYFNKYGPEANTRVLRYVRDVKVPALFIAGSEEPAFARHATSLHAALSGHVPATLQVIEGSDHNYTGRQEIVAGVFRSWLETLPV